MNIDQIVRSHESSRVLTAASGLLRSMPVTITSIQCARSAGGLHDFYSEGDYWWPDPTGKERPFVRRDGFINPDNFIAHRELLIEMSTIVSTLTAAWILTRDHRFSLKAIEHLIAWFENPGTRMNPSLMFGQAIPGLVTGRGIGIVDTVHLIEVAASAEILYRAGVLRDYQLSSIRCWFRQYVEWLRSHPYGIAEMNEKNNHATCWAVQMAAFGRFLEDDEVLSQCRARLKLILLPTQVAADGSFPLELERTRPYNYSMFNVELFTALCQIVQSDDDSLWHFELSDGRSVKSIVEHHVRYVRNRSGWPHPKDVMFDDVWPLRQCWILLGSAAYDRPDWLELWMSLPAESEIYEVKRNIFLRQPLLWITPR